MKPVRTAAKIVADWQPTAGIGVYKRLSSALREGRGREQNSAVFATQARYATRKLRIRTSELDSMRRARVSCDLSNTIQQEFDQRSFYPRKSRFITYVTLQTRVHVTALT